MLRPKTQFQFFSVWVVYFSISVYYYFMYIPDIYSNWVSRSALVCFQYHQKDFVKIFYSELTVYQR